VGDVVERSQSFTITELVDIFRAALVALLPAMGRARIKWNGDRVYDPWEDIERTLYGSIVGSCVENAVSPSNPYPLAAYGLLLPSYATHNFLVAQDRPNAAFVELRTAAEPFNEALFVELDEGFVPSIRKFSRPLAGLDFLLAAPRKDKDVVFESTIAYRD
jgi:hypothetical protein